MSLPKLDRPLYDLIIPSNNKKIKFRPFTVKEEKILLMALSSDDETLMEDAIKQLINNCVVSEKFNLEKLTLYDLEYLFLNLRARSIGETIELTFNPPEKTECNTCKKTKKISVDLLSIDIQKNPLHKNKLFLNENHGIVIQDPAYSNLKELKEVQKNQDFDSFIKLVAKCITEIFTDQQTYKVKDYKFDECLEFVESLSKKEFDLIEEFFETLPKLSYTIDLSCKECGHNQLYTLEGLKDFFV